MRRAGDLLNEVLARAGFDAEAPQARIFQVWDDILGADLTGHVRLRDVDRGRLIVEVDHPAWMQLVQMRQRRILGRVRRRFPQLGVTRLYLLVSPPGHTVTGNTTKTEQEAGHGGLQTGTDRLESGESGRAID